MYLAPREVITAALAPNGPITVAASTTFNLPIEHWSASSFSLFQRCPRAWQQRYVQKRRERPGEALLVGSTLHKVVEANFKRKMESHADLPLTTLLEFFSTAFPVVVEEEEKRAKVETAWDTSPEDANERGRGLLAAYMNQVAPRIQPIAVEQMLSVEIGLAVPITGRLDIETEKVVIDLKSGKTARRKPKEDWLIQALIYSTATGKPVEFHSVTASMKRGDVTIVTPLESEDLLIWLSPAQREAQLHNLRELSDYACHLMDKHGPDEPWPTLGRFHGWACDPRYCSYRGDCPAWRE